MSPRTDAAELAWWRHFQAKQSNDSQLPKVGSPLVGHHYSVRRDASVMKNFHGSGIMEMRAVGPGPTTADLVIAYIHPGQVTGRFCDSLTRTILHDAGNSRRIAGVIALQSSPRIAEARSQVVDMFAEQFPDADWLLMIDADMAWNPSDIDLLLEAASRDTRPIVGGLCFTWDGPDNVKPVMFRLLDNSGRAEIIRDYPAGELVEVDSTGGAFLLVHRQVFAKMREQYGQRADGSQNPYPWFVEGMVTSQGVALGEDTAFCLRAKSMGIPIFVHCGARIGHEKSIVLTEAMFKN